MTRTIGWEAEARFDWLALTRALAEGHSRPKAEIGDTFLYRGADTLLSRAAWIDGLGQLVKTATIFPGNPDRGLASINGGAMLFADETGQLAAILDFHLLTKWKTAGDSLLAALQLAPDPVRRVLIVGAGTVAASLIQAYGAGFPDAALYVWARRPATAETLAATTPGVAVAHDLPQALADADIVVSATMATAPVIQGAWLRPGQHLDLIGAYRPDMREVDDAALARARVFVDSRDTTLGHIGELKIPLETGAISEADIVADYYQLDRFTRRTADEITICKNGGGAHLDLMTAHYMLDAAGA